MTSAPSSRLVRQPLVVIARLDAKPGREAEVAAALLAIVEPTRAEEGCRSYVPSVADGHPGRFVVFEQWRDDAALDAHFGTPHMASFLAVVPDLLETAVRIERLREMA